MHNLLDIRLHKLQWCTVSENYAFCSSILIFFEFVTLGELSEIQHKVNNVVNNKKEKANLMIVLKFSHMKSAA